MGRTRRRLARAGVAALLLLSTTAALAAGADPSAGAGAHDIDVTVGPGGFFRTAARERELPNFGLGGGRSSDSASARAPLRTPKPQTHQRQAGGEEVLRLRRARRAPTSAQSQGALRNEREP
jgi:hypothetical protein